MKFGEWTKAEKQNPPEPKNELRGDKYLCTVINNQVVLLYYVKRNIKGKEIHRWEVNGRISPWKPIAFMPFPEPYTE